MKRILCVLVICLCFFTSSTAENLSNIFDSCPDGFEFGISIAKIQEMLKNANAASLYTSSYVPLWGEYLDSQHEIGFKIEDNKGGLNLSIGGVKPVCTTAYALYHYKEKTAWTKPNESDTYALKLETSEKTSAKDLKSIKKALTNKYGDPKKESVKVERKMSVGNKSKKTTFYLTEYTWEVDNIGIKLTSHENKKGEAIKDALEIVIMQTDLNDYIKEHDQLITR